MVSGAGQFVNSASTAQSPPFYALLAPDAHNGGYSGRVSQSLVLNGAPSYVISTFFRPLSLSPIPSDGDVPQRCVFTISFGSATLFSRNYASNNGTQIGYSYVQVNNVQAPARSGTTDIDFSYDCPDGYIGSGSAQMVIDMVSVRGAGIVSDCVPIVDPPAPS